MKLLRFRLSSVLIAFTVVAVLLGYTQVRRRNLNQAFAELGAQGCSFRYKDHWLWPVAPKYAEVTFREWPSGEYSVEAPNTQQPLMSSSERLGRFRFIRAELMTLGIKDVSMLNVWTDPSAGGDVTDSIALESIGL